MEPGEIIETYCAENGLRCTRLADGSWAVQVPGTERRSLNAVFQVGTYHVSCTAFFIRQPDLRREEFYRLLLHINLEQPLLRFATDDHGDVFLRADVSLAAFDERGLDEVLGLLSQAVTRHFPPIFRRGFEA